MATYLELSSLATDASFLARVGYAIGKYAAYIFNEAVDAANHATRLNWAIKAANNTQAMANTLAGAVRRADAVVAGLAGVADADLQTATETAANTVIAAPVSYLDLMTLASDPVFTRRVQVAVAKFAAYILGEAPTTANHSARYAWAKQAVLNTMGVATALATAVVVSENIPTPLNATSDADLQTALEFEAQQLLL